MEKLLPHLLAITLLSLLCMGWIGVQMLARKMKTKNHFDDRPGCGTCSGTGECTKRCESESGEKR